MSEAVGWSAPSASLRRWSLILASVAMAVLGLALIPRTGSGQKTPEAALIQGPSQGVQEALHRDLEALDRLLATEPDDPELRRHRLQSLYVLSVEERECLAEARRELAVLENLQAGEQDAAVLDAYDGALSVVEAKHAFWPHDKVLKLREGLTALDALVEEHPAHAEIRFLRLASSYFLPFPFSRPRIVEEDLIRLKEQLLDRGSDMPPRVRVPAATFVLDHGAPADSVRARLEETLEEARAEAATSAPADTRDGSDG